MYENGERLSPTIEQRGPTYKEELIHFDDDVSAFRITGERGARFNFSDHPYRPNKPLGHAIVYTTSGDYLAFTRDEQTAIVHFTENEAVEVYHNSYRKALSEIAFGKQWQIRDSYETSGLVKSALLLYEAYADRSVGIAMNGPSPFDRYVRRLHKPMHWCRLSDHNSSPYYMP